MTTQPKDLRVLLPAKPEDDMVDAERLLRALLPPASTHVRRLYVHRPLEADFHIPAAYPRFQELSQLEFDAENATRHETEQEMKPLANDGFTVSAEVVCGTPTEEILREASIWRADMVAVRTRSLSARDHRIGGMASALLYHGTCPVLTHEHVAEGYRLRRILVPIDFSEGSRKSIDWGLALSGLTGAELVLVHAIAPWNGRHGIDQDELSQMASAEMERWRARANSILPEAVEAARIVTASDPAEGILRCAREEACDLIVLSATGASVARSILVGANTRRVVRASACPVLVVPSSNRVPSRDFLARAVNSSRPEPASATRGTSGRTMSLASHPF
jgi:nucleotide-binding universal stress UspA family protein